jgi:gamma-glutamyl-gamma-aminobutyrate hydrolase PuuD
MMKTVALLFRNPNKAVPYQCALRQVDLDPVSFIPDAPGPLDDVHGLVLTGGSDVDPAIYGADPHPENGPSDRARDDYESALLREALARDMPVLAICRGMQLLNVVRGGTLIQHLPNADKHRQQNGGVAVHEVVLAPPFDSIYGVPRMQVNSRHHQAVDCLGEGLLVTARDPEDGVIEGIDLSGAQFAVGVQWHPEDMMDDPIQMRLFRAFARSV